jgi:hypothetical protein
MNTKTKPSGWINIGLGVRVAERCTIRATDDAWPFEVELETLVEGSRTVVQRVELRRLRGADEGVTPDGLRAVPLGEIVRRALTKTVRFASTPHTTMSADPAGLEESERLERAAVIYRLAALGGDPATQAVAQDLGVSRATAGRIVARAREQGLLGPAVGTRAGEGV